MSNQPNSLSRSEKLLERIWRGLFTLDRWNIAIGRLDDASIHDIIERSQLPALNWLPPGSRSHYRADPFIWFADDGPRVLYEEYPEWRARAKIGSLPLDADGGLCRTEIEGKFHLSYPFVLRQDDHWLCVPESAEAGGVDLYRWDPSTLTWRVIQRLIHEPVLDPTLINHEGRWYIFGTLLNDGPRDKLRIWHSCSLTGPWNRHVQDPAKIDIGSSRSAGNLFRHRGSLFRPAQDCTNGYGRAITLNRIESLSETSFSETTQSRLCPDESGPYPHGLHTFSASGGWFAIDGKRRQFHLLAALFKTLWIVGHKLRRVRLPKVISTGHK